MTTLTENGVTTTQANGQENYEMFYSDVLRKNLVQYDYRHTNGELFSCVKPTLEQCRDKRDNWLNK
jgi:hypothetical protein